MQETIHLERISGGRARVLLDRPPHNAIDSRTREQLRAVLSELAADPELRVLVLASATEHFSVGNDIRELAAIRDGGAAQLVEEWDDLARRLRELPAVVVAAVSGYALGGGFELAMSCDLRIVSPDAQLAATATSLGLVLSTHTLAQSLPDAIARELLFTARRLDAEEARALGLVNAVVPRSELERAVDELVTTIARRSPAAIRHGKRLMNLAASTGREAHDRLQRDAFAELMASPEHAEAVSDFLTAEADTYSA
jgi:enoyl-CoA hydratase/carnithine racemase